jgi:hypothetical protein
MVHVRRYFLALSVLLGAYCAYAVALAPWIAPPRVARLTATVAPAPAAVSRLPPELVELFPPDAWERQNPTIVETEQCKLLIRDYVTTPDGRLELVPCTLIFQSSGKEHAGRPIVLQAPKAELTFDKAFDIAKGEFGRVEKGTLSGEVRIFSPASQADGRDAFYLKTRAVWLDRQSIHTANDVEFRYGDSSGRGRDLEITLLEPAVDGQQPKRKFRGIHTLSLKRLHSLRVAIAPGGLAPNNVQQEPQTPTAPLEITCQGEFTFDVPRQLARFQDRVRVEQAAIGAVSDSLTCHELLLDMARGKDAPPAALPAPDDPLTGRLQRVIAIGQPAVLQSPSRGIRADAAYMEYSLAARSLYLKTDPGRQIQAVTLRQFDQYFTAPEIHYEMPQRGRLGRLNASGPGELRLIDRRGGQEGLVTARWQRALDIQPQEQNHVISLREAASVEMQGMGRFSADELHLWVRESAAPKMPTGASGPAGTSGPASILPDRMLAIGSVQMASLGLDMDTGRLEAWFMHLPVEEPPKQQPRGIDHPIREPVAPASYTEEARPAAAIRDARPQVPIVQRFYVSGDVVRTQLVVRGNKFDLEDLSIRGHARIDEVQTPEPNLVPLRVRGDFLELRAGTRPDATAEISGFPAEVAGRGMALAGSKIEMRRAQNEVRIDGPGEARLPARGGIVPLPGGTEPAQDSAAVDGGELHLLWQQGMTFDGLVARFSGDVEVRTASQTARMPALEATLNRRLDFALPPADMTPIHAAEPVGLARVLLDGQERGVWIESRGVDEQGELQSRDQVNVPSLDLDQVSGAVHAQGPGWVSTVRRGAPHQGEAPGRAGLAPSHQPEAPARDLHKPEAQARELTSIHIAFEREMVGDLNQRWIEFRQEVRTTYSPASDFGEVIVADPLASLGERMALMRSQTLRITDTSFTRARSFELKAEGGTTVEARNVVVDAPRVSYSSDKETLTIEGDGRVTATVHRPQGRLEGQRLWYNLRTGQSQLDVTKSIQFGLGPDVKLPLRGR